MAASDGKVIIDTHLNNKGFIKGVNGLKGQLGGLESVIGKLGKMIASAFAVGTIVKFGKECIDLASDVQEVQNVVDAAFGDTAYKIEQFSKGAIENFGLSQLTAKRTASTYMAMAKGMGIAEDVGSDMAITLTGLTADMASFYNVSQEMADTAIKSVFTGETESLKQFGIVMTDVNLEQYALSRGIKKSISAMTQQEKTMLRYGYVMEQTNLAQGDFVRTQDSFANKTRVLTEKWKEMQAVFGETFIILADSVLPVLEIIVEKLTIVALYIAAFAKGMRGSNKEAEKAAEGTQALGEQTDKTAKSIENTAEAVKNIGKETKKTSKSLAQFDELMILHGGSVSSSGIGSSLGGIISPNISKELSALQSFLDDDTMKNLQDFEKWVSDNKDGIKTALEIAGLAGLGLAIGNVVGKIGNLLGVFKKKDKGLDTQTSKTQAETSAVKGLSGEFALVTAAALALIPVLGKLTNSGEDLSPELQGLTDSALALSPAMQDATESVNGLSPALETAKDSVVSFDSVTETAMQNAGINVENATKNAKANIKSFSAQTKPVFVDWCTVMQKNAVNASTVIAQNIYNALSSAGQNFTEFINSTSTSFSEWATNISGNMEVASKNITSPFLEALSAAWESFKSFMFATGQKLSGVWKEHKAKIVTVGAIAGLSIAGIALAPYTGGVSLALPALAQGAVIPPNREFMAVLGDQKSGTNIETPLATMVQAFKQAMAESGGGGAQTIILQIDGREFGRAVKKYGGREDQRVGVSLVGVRG